MSTTPYAAPTITTSRIRRALLGGKPHTLNELEHKLTDVSDRTIRYHLAALEAAGLVEAWRSNHRVIYVWCDESTVRRTRALVEWLTSWRLELVLEGDTKGVRWIEGVIGKNGSGK